jgi:uncharacterized repeat protein (TIGR03987 family)
MIILSSILITLALVFYSIGIWAERLKKNLLKWHLVAFWFGFMFDLLGTYSMHIMANGKFNFWSLHTFTGQLAIWLMFIHAVWATIVIIRNNEIARKKFHKYSLIVWLIWLIPYLGGMYIGMSR